MKTRVWLLSVTISAVLIACGGETNTSKQEVRVFAASSLTEAFSELETEYEKHHPDIDIQTAFAGSQVLRMQIEHGAEADVFASANPAHTEELKSEGLIAEEQLFAKNKLVVVVPKENPAGIGEFRDLGKAKRIVVGTENVPVGAYTRQALSNASTAFGDGFQHTVESHIVSEETNVRLVRAKVELGEADAGVVYQSDVVASAKVQALPIPDQFNAEAAYPIATLSHAKNPSEAHAFITFVLSSPGQAILKKHGFITGLK